MLLVALIQSFNNKVQAQDLGVIGPNYEIKEVDFLSWIKDRLKMLQREGRFSQWEKRFEKNVMHHIDRPARGENITRAPSTHVFKYDPTIVIPYDIYGAHGEVLYRMGTKLNPLTRVSLRKPLIFFNSDDKEEVIWAINQDKNLNGEDKLILVQGSLFEQMKQWKRKIYFDQAGTLIHKLGIKHLPAIVTQEGTHLLIKEVKL